MNNTTNIIEIERNGWLTKAMQAERIARSDRAKGCHGAAEVMQAAANAAWRMFLACGE